MASENRTWTQTLYGPIAAQKFNDVQDYWTLGWQFYNSTLSPTIELEGPTLYYGQASIAGIGPAPIDQSRDWRNRAIWVRVIQVANAGGGGSSADLPGGASYDPADTAQDDSQWNLFGTEGGANLANPPVGVSWNPFGAPWGNEWIYASNTTSGGITAGDLVWSNYSGTTAYFMFFILQTNDIS